MGPTLATVSERKSVGWILAHFKNPPSLTGGKSPPATRLGDEQLNMVAAFVLNVTPESARGLEDAPNFAVEGARIFQENRCWNCHLVNGVGMAVGPPLAGIGSRRPKESLREKIRNPRASVPDTLMPVYSLPPEELEALALYLVQLPDH